MKTAKTNFLLLSMLGVFSFLFTACSDDQVVVRKSGYKSWFTVKVTENDSYYFLHDKGKTFVPVAGLKNYKPEKDHRAFVYYDVSLLEDSEGYDYPIHVYRMDTILSKQIAENLEEKNELVYGNDPLRIDRMWVGGDFLNIRFSTYWGGRKAHFVNLIAENDENPYELRFRHNAYDDPRYSWGYGWVAFDLTSLPVSEDGEIELSIKVQTYEGLKEKKFTYIPGNEDVEDPDENEEEDENDDTQPAAGALI